MRDTLDVPITDRCMDCGEVSPGSFCRLPEPAFSSFKTAKASYTFDRGSTVFMQGESVRGVYLLCSGRAKLSTYSEDGKAIILRIAEPGEVLGLSAVFTDMPHENTAQAIERSRISFIKKNDFLALLETSHEAALTALCQLSKNYYKAHLQICSLGLSTSAGDKLAKLLLQWCEPAASGPHVVRIEKRHTHSEIAEMIGSSRETVTRLLRDFKDRGLIDFSRTELVIPDPGQLKAAIGTRYRNGNGHL